MAAIMAATALGFSILGQLAARVPLPPPRHPAAYLRHLVVENPYAVEDPSAAWYKGDIHLASVRSIGKDFPAAIGAYFRARGYGFLAVTDINTYTWVEEYARRPLTGIPAVQVSYPFASLLALNVDHWMPAATLQEAVNWIRQGGGLAILAAPRAVDKPQLESQAIGTRGLFAVEVYDGRLGALDPAHADATGLWDKLLSNGQRVFAVAGDDVVDLRDASAGSAWIEVLALSDDATDLTTSLQQGAFYASSGAQFTNLGVNGRTIVAQAAGGATLRFIGKGGRLLSAVAGATGSYAVTGTERYVRVEAVADSGARAWSQPFFVSWQ